MDPYDFFFDEDTVDIPDPEIEEDLEEAEEAMQEEPQEIGVHESTLF